MTVSRVGRPQIRDKLTQTRRAFERARSSHLTSSNLPERGFMRNVSMMYSKVSGSQAQVRRGAQTLRSRSGTPRSRVRHSYSDHSGRYGLVRDFIDENESAGGADHGISVCCQWLLHV